MPYLGVDPWRWQYFEKVPCPRGTIVPIDDATAWTLYPRHRWVYDKLAICASQGLPHGPHGTEPPHYPVFSKPIYIGIEVHNLNYSGPFRTAKVSNKLVKNFLKV